MQPHTWMKRAVMVSAWATLFFGVIYSYAADPPKSPPGSVPTGATVAAGAVEDTLNACLARIPKEATAGQRMLAELSCQRDEGLRPAYQSSPRK